MGIFSWLFGFGSKVEDQVEQKQDRTTPVSTDRILPMIPKPVDNAGNPSTISHSCESGGSSERF
jgi:hypothetical protein